MRQIISLAFCMLFCAPIAMAADAAKDSSAAPAAGSTKAPAAKSAAKPAPKTSTAAGRKLESKAAKRTANVVKFTGDQLDKAVAK